MLKVFQKEHLSDVIKAVIYALSISIVAVLLYAIAVKYLVLSDTTVVIGNTLIKIISLLLGIFCAFRHHEQGALKGTIVGIIYVFVSHFVFSIVSGVGLFAGLDLIGCLFGVVVGAISGIIVVNVRK